MKPTLVIAGFGRLARAIVGLQPTDQFDVYGLRRTAGQMPEGVTEIIADVTTVTQNQLPAAVDYLVYCPAPAVRDEKNYHHTYVLGIKRIVSLLNTVAVKKIIYISSTGVYGQDNGEWVNEVTPPSATTVIAKTLLAAEQALSCSENPYAILRCSGIYGDLRSSLLQSVREQEVFLTSKPHYRNRIHEKDCAAFVWHVINNQGLSGKFLVTDDAPVDMNEVYTWLNRQCFGDTAAMQTREIPEIRGKRCSNHKLKQSGFELKYPTYIEGYGALLS